MVCGPNFWVKSSGGGALRVIAGEPGNHTESARGPSIVFGFELYLNCISTRFVLYLYGEQGGAWRVLEKSLRKMS